MQTAFGLSFLFHSLRSEFGANNLSTPHESPNEYVFVKD